MKAVENEQDTSTLQDIQRKSPPSSEKRDFLRNPDLAGMNSEKLARGLGWFSIGLGLTELATPKVVAKISGISRSHTALIRFYGLRELAAGIGILGGEKTGGCGLVTRRWRCGRSS